MREVNQKSTGTEVALHVWNLSGGNGQYRQWMSALHLGGSHAMWKYNLWFFTAPIVTHTSAHQWQPSTWAAGRQMNFIVTLSPW